MEIILGLVGGWIGKGHALGLFVYVYTHTHTHTRTQAHTHILHLYLPVSLEKAFCEMQP